MAKKRMRMQVGTCFNVLYVHHPAGRDSICLIDNAIQHTNKANASQIGSNVL